ncbi:rRNA maturation RNase YbeY [Candidatus Berkelbacteria bacterium]|nr:rRNA maturation RNase YbeY [Candidatus Berkelbacteria bacterium]
MSLRLDVLEDLPSPVSTPQFHRALENLCKKEFGNRPIILEILMTTNARMQVLNGAARGHHTTTDVLSLPVAIDTNRGIVVPIGTTPLLLGTIVVALPQAAAQVGRFGDSLETEVLGLVKHGFQHLLGHDHDANGTWH